jgi:hypothetical protein
MISTSGKRSIGRPRKRWRENSRRRRNIINITSAQYFEAVSQEFQVLEVIYLPVW